MRRLITLVLALALVLPWATAQTKDVLSIESTKAFTGNPGLGVYALKDRSVLVFGKTIENDNTLPEIEGATKGSAFLRKMDAQQKELWNLALKGNTTIASVAEYDGGLALAVTVTGKLEGLGTLAKDAFADCPFGDTERGGIVVLLGKEGKLKAKTYISSVPTPNAAKAEYTPVLTVGGPQTVYLTVLHRVGLKLNATDATPVEIAGTDAPGAWTTIPQVQVLKVDVATAKLQPLLGVKHNVPEATLSTFDMLCNTSMNRPILLPLQKEGDFALVYGGLVNTKVFLAGDEANAKTFDLGVDATTYSLFTAPILAVVQDGTLAGKQLVEKQVYDPALDFQVNISELFLTSQGNIGMLGSHTVDFKLADGFELQASPETRKGFFAEIAPAGLSPVSLQALEASTNLVKDPASGHKPLLSIAGTLGEEEFFYTTSFQGSTTIASETFNSPAEDKASTILVAATLDAGKVTEKKGYLLSASENVSPYSIAALPTGTLWLAGSYRGKDTQFMGNTTDIPASKEEAGEYKESAGFLLVSKFAPKFVDLLVDVTKTTDGAFMATLKIDGADYDLATMPVHRWKKGVEKSFEIASSDPKLYELKRVMLGDKELTLTEGKVSYTLPESYAQANITLKVEMAKVAPSDPTLSIIDLLVDVTTADDGAFMATLKIDGKDYDLATMPEHKWKKGEAKTFEIASSDPERYALKRVMLGDTELKLTDGKVSYTLPKDYAQVNISLRVEMEKIVSPFIDLLVDVAKADDGAFMATLKIDGEDYDLATMPEHKWKKGEAKTFEIAPSNQDLYELKRVMIGTQELTLTDGKVSYTLPEDYAQANITLKVEMAKIVHPTLAVTIKKDFTYGKVTIDYEGKTYTFEGDPSKYPTIPLRKGKSMTVTAKPNEGFVFKSLQVNGEAKNSPATLTVEGDVKIVASFERGHSTPVDAAPSAQLAVSPNPVQNILFVQGLESASTLRIYSLNGALLYTAPVRPNAGVDVSWLSAGVYILRVGSTDIRFVKQ